METTDVYVANFEGLYTRIEDLESTVQSVVYRTVKGTGLLTTFQANKVINNPVPVRL